MAARSVDGFLAALPEEQRAALADLRAHLHRLVPEATESINYGVPALKLDGRPLVSYGAARERCSFYVQSPVVLARFAGELTGYRLSTGTIGFTPDRPIPRDVLERIVRARVDEVRSRS